MRFRRLHIALQRAEFLVSAEAFSRFSGIEMLTAQTTTGGHGGSGVFLPAGKTASLEDIR
jgi:hypothetical protein